MCLVNLGGSWHEEPTLLVTHFSAPILAYPIRERRAQDSTGGGRELVWEHTSCDVRPHDCSRGQRTRLVASSSVRKELVKQKPLVLFIRLPSSPLLASACSYWLVCYFCLFLSVCLFVHRVCFPYSVFAIVYWSGKGEPQKGNARKATFESPMKRLQGKPNANLK